MSISLEFSSFEPIGRNISSSKTKYTWGLRIGQRIHCVVLTNSKFSSIFRLFFDGETLIELVEPCLIAHSFNFKLGENVLSIKNSMEQRDVYVLRVDQWVFPPNPGPTSSKPLASPPLLPAPPEEKADTHKADRQSYKGSVELQNSGVGRESRPNWASAVWKTSDSLSAMPFPEAQLIESTNGLGTSNKGIEVFGFAGGRYPQESSNPVDNQSMGPVCRLRESLVYTRASTLCNGFNDLDLSRLKTIMNEQTSSKLMRSVYRP